MTAIRDRLAALKELDKRREAILASLGERGLLTPELRAKVEAADALTVLEDIYLPYRPKRRTRASMAKERGLEPLADQLARQDRILPEAMAAAYVDAEKGVPDAEARLQERVTSLRSASPRISPPANACVNSSGAKGSCGARPFPARKRIPRRQVPRLFRVGRTRRASPFPPHPRHVPGRRGRLPAPLRRWR